MRGMMAVLRKELADHFASKRFIILFLLIYLAGVAAIYIAGQNIRNEVSESTRFVFLRLFIVSGEQMPPFPFFMSLFVPIIGIALGFDAMNSERTSGNLSRLLSQPLYRDSLISAKFIAGVVVIGVLVTSIVAIVSGLGLRMLGIAPSGEEALRLLLFVIVTIIYGAFWLGLAIMFSIFFERTAVSALASIALWIFVFFFVSVIAESVANAVVPVDQNSQLDVLIRNEEFHQAISRLSPSTLYGESIQVMLMPEFGSASAALMLISIYTSGMVPTPLPVSQSLLIVWPQLVALVALTAVCFAIGYIRFMREEIRST
ncbi:MAG: ABC transporter permease subunit [Chloroflexota bacterium]